MFKSVSTLESNTNTRINGLSSSLKTTDDIAKLAFDNAAEAQQTGTTAVKATEALSQNLLSLKSQTQVTSGVRAVVTSKGIDDWTQWRTTGEAKVIQDADALGGYILELGNNAGNDEAWVHWNEFQKLIQISCIECVHASAVCLGKLDLFILVLHVKCRPK